MKIELMDRITLEDDTKYIVANTLEYNNKIYYLLVNDEDDTDIMIAYLENMELLSIEDVDEYKKILLKFNTDIILKNMDINDFLN